MKISNSGLGGTGEDDVVQPLDVNASTESAITGNNNCIPFNLNLNILKIANCRGGKVFERGCCSSEYPCQLGEGDCDMDFECSGGLVCGNNNCGPEFLWSSADCCEGKLIETMLIHT